MSKHLYRSRYALAVLHVRAMIYKDRDLLTAEEKNCSKQRKKFSLSLQWSALPRRWLLVITKASNSSTPEARAVRGRAGT